MDEKSKLLKAPKSSSNLNESDIGGLENIRHAKVEER